MSELDIETVKGNLYDYLDLENDEFTEACQAMCRLHDMVNYLGNDELKVILEKEIRKTYEYYKSEYRIVTKEVTYTVKATVLEEIEDEK